MAKILLRRNVEDKMSNRFNSIKSFLITGSVIVLCGCANMNSIYREAHIDKGHSAIVDAKQRAIITSSWFYKDSDGDGTYDVANRRVCAEPSPDAMSVFASAGGFGANIKDKAEVFGKIASSESGANIGLRTHSIQLLRDSFFRTCEAYLNGGIDEIEYALQMRRFQTSMIALISIEQLTGVVKPPAVVLTAAGSNETGDVLTKLVATRSELVASKTNRETAKAAVVSEIADSDTKIGTNQTEIDTKKAEKKTLDADNDGELDKEPDGTTDATKKQKWDKLTTEISSAVAKVKELKEEKDKQEKKQKSIEAEISSTESVIAAVDKNIQAAETGNLKTVASGLTLIDASQQQIDGLTRRHIADVVESITKEMIKQDLGATRCFDYMKSRGGNNTINVNEQKIFDICESILRNYQNNGDVIIKRNLLHLKSEEARIDAKRQKNELAFSAAQRALEDDEMVGGQDNDHKIDSDFDIRDLFTGEDSFFDGGVMITSKPPQTSWNGEITG